MSDFYLNCFFKMTILISFAFQFVTSYKTRKHFSVLVSSLLYVVTTSLTNDDMIAIIRQPLTSACYFLSGLTVSARREAEM